MYRNLPFPPMFIDSQLRTVREFSFSRLDCQLECWKDGQNVSDVWGGLRVFRDGRRWSELKLGNDPILKLSCHLPRKIHKILSENKQHAIKISPHSDYSLLFRYDMIGEGTIGARYSGLACGSLIWSSFGKLHRTLRASGQSRVLGRDLQFDAIYAS